MQFYFFSIRNGGVPQPSKSRELVWVKTLTLTLNLFYFLGQNKPHNPKKTLVHTQEGSKPSPLSDYGRYGRYN